MTAAIATALDTLASDMPLSGDDRDDVTVVVGAVESLMDDWGFALDADRRLALTAHSLAFTHRSPKSPWPFPRISPKRRCRGCVTPCDRIAPPATAGSPTKRYSSSPCTSRSLDSHPETHRSALRILVTIHLGGVLCQIRTHSPSSSATVSAKANR
jgi:hypothetical protein